MTEASWGDAAASRPIDWTMSAALENVVRGGDDIAEVTNLHEAVQAWRELDPEHRARAILILDHPVRIDGALANRFEGEGIGILVERLPG
ncbi:hypothetical protein IAG41_00455 [Sphingomonas sp. JC676]|uniref:hypothetical protein n=1 Tax=Sphingomonas sp. JC676 TaxID=2768065 RepID=UPI0016586166|nr:hypothetical protein [Sphingomonas sp. JC676]MBC9030851.1 hypothetical protein [Sphingomonas sp. JC676]